MLLESGKAKTEFYTLCIDVGEEEEDIGKEGEYQLQKACSDMALELGKIKTEFTLYVLILVSTFVQRRFLECSHCTQRHTVFWPLLVRFS
jgi:hypothetical protein